MTGRKGLLGISAAIAVLAGLVLWDHGDAPAPLATASAATDAQAGESIKSARLAEPLVAAAATTAEEDIALAHALEAHGKRAKPDDLSNLVMFVTQYPESGWTSSILTNMGLSYLHYGYFSKALDAWERAWRLGKTASQPEAKALVDRAVGELLLLSASLGHFDRVATLFDEIGSRAVSGPATEAVQVAREALTQANNDPRHLFVCGPISLRSLMLARGVSHERLNFLQWYKVGPNGTNLAELAGLADRAEAGYRVVFRSPGQPVPVPSVVHWKVGHFAAILGEANGRFEVDDLVSRGSRIWVTPDALDSEASGYYLVPAASQEERAWRTVDLTEAAKVWGKGPTSGTRPGAPGEPEANQPDVPLQESGDGSGSGDGSRQKPCPMCVYGIKEASVSLTLSDTPVGYDPAIGPSARVRLTYNQREDSQPANFSFFNVSQKWTLNWLRYVQDDPPNAGVAVTRNLPGGGSYSYTGYNATTGRFAAQNDDGTILVRVSASPIVYQRLLRNGGIETYSQSDGSASYPRRIFLSKIADPQGNALTFTYDGQLRLTSITDAVGRQTTLTYGLSTRPLLITQITDPFGRNAKLTYDTVGRLVSITDIIGLTSSFTYDANSLVNSLTTPYGTTNFSYTAPGASGPPRFVQVTDPMGFGEREEWLEPSSNPASDPANTVPVGMPLPPTNNYLQYRNSFHWDKNAYLSAGCTPTGGCDYTKARIRHFTHWIANNGLRDSSLESVKYPLKNRIWYSLPGQTNSVISGTYNRPAAIGRVLDDGTTQLTRYSYDTTGFFNLTQMVDPLGRTTNFTYSNQIDLAAITQVTERGFLTTIAQYTYNYQHRPATYTDAAGQTTLFGYNTKGQLTSVTNPLGQKTTYQYDTSFNLTTVINANNQTAATYTYDTFARVRTYTDSEGWTVTYDYDAADRITKKTYPDATFETFTYDKLDLVAYTDRQFRTWTYVYDANRRLTSVTDPRGDQTQFGYNRNGQITSLTDPRSNTTGWAYDVQGRLTLKTYPDTTATTYVYENTTSRLKSVTDALNQVKTYSYAKDDLLTGITYTNAVNTTPNVTFAYDPYFPRITSRTDGTGTTQFTYVPVGSLGALQVQTESGPLANSTISSAYDELGRLASRTVQGAGAEAFQYDALGRLSVHASDLGTFNLGYLGQTGQITSRQLASSTLATTWSYLNNVGDRRLSGINNTGLSASHFSNFTFTTTPENFISGISESSDATAVYPATGSQTATYNNLNQLTNLSGQALTFDAVGNLTSDGQRNYAWDAENRLVSITYPGQPGKLTTFTYDGLDRRRTISSTPPGGGSATTTSYVWCDGAICQARDGSNATARGYYDEGEYVPGAPAQTLYYGIDQIGTVRRVFASTSSAPAYGYDAYGAPLQATAPITDLIYGGMLYNADSGLYLATYRTYGSIAGRWLSRDPMDGLPDPIGNLYEYGAANPVSFIDPLGLQPEGHHWVIGPIRNDPNLSPEARKIFRDAATGYYGERHGWSKEHQEYNKAVQELWNKKNYDPSKMTKQEAQKFVDQIMRSRDPRIRDYRQAIFDKCVKYGMRRMPFTSRNEP
jgi:RHS repeat-associated protein